MHARRKQKFSAFSTLNTWQLYGMTCRYSQRYWYGRTYLPQDVNRPTQAGYKREVATSRELSMFQTNTATVKILNLKPVVPERYARENQHGLVQKPCPSPIVWLKIYNFMYCPVESIFTCLKEAYFLASSSVSHTASATSRVKATSN